MVDWTKSMEQSFEYYEVDPNTWKDIKLIDNIKSSTLSRDSSSDTLGSASIDIVDSVGECYIRIYLVTIQNGVKEKHPLGTYLVQTPSSKFDGKNKSVTMDAYTPLLELKENPVPLGYASLKDENIMSQAYRITRENCRAPVIETKSEIKLLTDFVSNTDDNWLTYTRDLIAQAKYGFDVNEMGQILFAPNQNAEELQPVYTFNDDNSSILYPEITLNHDLYGIPNVVEVIGDTGTDTYCARVENNDPNSPTSIPRRGREILHRITDPDLPGYPTKEQLDEYAENVLKELSSVEYEISYSHGYCPVRVGDCVRLNYKKAELVDVKAKVISQSIKCKAGCSVSEKATFTRKLWK